MKFDDEAMWAGITRHHWRITTVTKWLLAVVVAIALIIVAIRRSALSFGHPRSDLVSVYHFVPSTGDWYLASDSSLHVHEEGQYRLRVLTVAVRVII